MENTNDKQLSFPQRNWFLICVLVAILSPVVVHWVQAAAHKEAYKESVETRPVNSDNSKGLPPQGGGAAGGTSEGKDTSYKMSAPPTDSGKKKQ